MIMVINLWVSNKAEHLDHLWNCQYRDNFLLFCVV